MIFVGRTDMNNDKKDRMGVTELAVGCLAGFPRQILGILLAIAVGIASYREIGWWWFGLAVLYVAMPSSFLRTIIASAILGWCGWVAQKQQVDGSLLTTYWIISACYIFLCIARIVCIVRDFRAGRLTEEEYLQGLR